jgi:copper transport protein
VTWAARIRRSLLAAACLFVLAPAATAWAHAALLRTSPQGSVTVIGSPKQVTLTYSEAVEPKFAVVSVTDQNGTQEASGAPYAAPQNADTLVVPIRHLNPGWYLVYWRVISADGHPVRGAFTFAVGPNPGPAPQFVIPSLSESAATPSLIASRWAVFLAVMLAAGLFTMRTMIARPVAVAAPRAMRALTISFLACAAISLVAIPVYMLVTTASFALSSVTDVAKIVPLITSSALGRALVDMEVIVALFAAAGAVAIAIDHSRGQRSVAALLAQTGAMLAGGAMLAVPGLAGHAAQTSPAGLAWALDWLHMVTTSLWLGGLAGLLVLGATAGTARRASLARVVPRFSRVATVSVLGVIASGTGAAILHLPTLATLWDTSYGKAILVKIALLAAALVLGGLNNARTSPRLVAAEAHGDDGLGASSARMLRGLVTGEVLLVTATVGAAMVLSSLPPPAKALASLGAVSAHVGPGRVHTTVHEGPYTLDVTISPNRAAAPSTFAVRITRGNTPLRGATVIAHFLMLDMDMQAQAYTMTEGPPGTYTRSTPALVMVGHWGLEFQVEPRVGAPFTVVIVDKAEG